MPQTENKPAAFIHKLCNILRSKEHAKVIHWDTELKGIRILNQKKLEELILPRYYRHNRFASFVRQLNMYDFHKVHLPDHRYIFRHNEFDPKKKQQIHLIRRKVTFQSKQSEQCSSDNNIQVLQSKRENQAFDPFFKSSNKMILRHSLYILGSQRNNQNQILPKEKALEELKQVLQEFKQNKAELDQKIKQLKKDKKYRSHIKNTQFLKQLYSQLGSQYIEEQDNLSELSIEDELMFKTKRSLPLKSLKLVQSGQLVFRKDTLRNFLNF